MSQNVPTHYAQQYGNNVQLLLQQKGSKLRPTVTEQPITGAKAAVPVEQIGAVTAQRRTTRYPSLTPQDTPTDRPWVYPVDYDWNDLVDSIDKLRMIIDPTSSYVTNGTYALGRAIDDEIIAAFFGIRKTGETGATSNDWATTGSSYTVAVNFGAAGNVGLTVAKLREAKRILMANEVDFDEEQVTIALTSKQHDNMLGEIQVVSMDFNERPVMVEGKITRFLGIDFKTIERLALDSNSYRRCPVYAKSGITLGLWNDVSSDVSQRKDLAGLPYQVYCFGTFGATRTEEKKLVEIKCN